MTIISASKSESFLTNLVCIEVFAILFNIFLSTGEIESAISSRYSLVFLAAFLYPSTIIVGWTSWSINDSACSSNAPAKTTAEVVPSPTSLSVVLEISTNIFAAGCWTSISLRIVAPSFVIVTSPKESTNILSIPRGPKLVWTISATILAAAILFFWASLPLVSEPPSFSSTTGIFPLEVACIPINGKTPDSPFIPSRSRMDRYRCF